MAEADAKIIISIDSDYEDIIPSFMEELASNLDNIRKGLDEGDFKLCKDSGHKIRSAGMYGFDVISKAGAVIEDVADSEDKEKIAECLAQVEDYRNRLEVVYE